MHRLRELRKFLLLVCAASVASCATTGSPLASSARRTSAAYRLVPDAAFHDQDLSTLPPAPPVSQNAPWVAFAGCMNGVSQLFLYDDGIKDVYAVPGAGVPISNPQVYSGGRIVYQRAGQILWWDPDHQLDFHFDGVGMIGPAIRPSMSWDGTRMVWIRPACWQAYFWTCVNGCQTTAGLTLVNQVGNLHGGVQWARISANGAWIVFTTGDGGLFIYDLVHPQVCEIPEARTVGNGHACDAALSPDGGQIVWTSGGCIFRYDRASRCVDSMPYANLALDNAAALDPEFMGLDCSTVYYEALVPPGGLHVLAYQWQTGLIRTLAILNSVTPDNTISNPGPVGPLPVPPLVGGPVLPPPVPPGQPLVAPVSIGEPGGLDDEEGPNPSGEEVGKPGGEHGIEGPALSHGHEQEHEHVVHEQDED